MKIIWIPKKPGRPPISQEVVSDNDPEFVARRLIKWLRELEVGPLFIEPGSPWENGYVESFNGEMRYELLNGEIFYSLLEATVVIERWRGIYNTMRPHSSLGGSLRHQVNPKCRKE